MIALISLSPAPRAEAAFGFKTLGLSFSDEEGTPATQAGSHPFAWTTSILFNTVADVGEALPDGALKDLRIQLPPGLVGTPGLLPDCSRAEFLAETCPAASEVGTIELSTSSPETKGEEYPLYNLEPLPGNAAELAFKAVGVPVVIELQIASAQPYDLIAQISNVTQATAFFGSLLTIHGIPGAVPFLTLPRSCAAAPTVFEADSWEAPAAWATAAAPEPLYATGCARLGFAPTLSARPTTTATHTSSGFDVELTLPNEGLVSPNGIANADLASASLLLPEGMTINLALAAGLSACTPAELRRETPDSAPGDGCPPASKIGTATLTTPVLEGQMSGTIYVAEPDDPQTTAAGTENPLDASFALYLLIRDSARGVLISVPIAVEPDPLTGRLRTRIERLPPLPFTDLQLHFNSGPRAPLLTPPGCGAHSIDYRLAPSSGAPPSTGTLSFTTDHQCAPQHFAPGLTAGTISNRAAQSAPFLFELRSDPREPNPATLKLTLPPGLAADLNAATTCPEADTSTAACPPASRIGEAHIALGPGAEPLWIPEAGHEPSSVYLAGPYRGAPYSLLVSVPAQAGPFDFGRLDLRAPLTLDPATAQATVSFAALPQIIAGVPLHYRAIRLLIDRPGFIRNPTSCAAMQIQGSAISAMSDTALLAEPFQAADCAALPFSPRLSLRLSGALARNGRPALKAVIKPRPGQANIAGAALTLPAAELLEYPNIRAVCSTSLYDAGTGVGERCPPASRHGSARVFTPLLERPLEGPLYLRTNSDPRKLPDLVASLSGGGVHLDYLAHVSAVQGLLRVAFEGLPDVPVENVVWQLRGGRHGLLVNTTGLCRAAPRVSASFLAHNRKRHTARPMVKLNCPGT